MRVLITGVTGFAGSHLAEYLLENQPEVEVWGLYRWRSRRENLEGVWGRLRMVECDLRDYTSVHLALSQARPDAIFHLAAQSFVPSSWKAPNDTLITNLTGQTNLFEAVRFLALDPVIQIACSSEEYGLVHPDEVPIKEDNPLRPLSPYAVSKVGQDMMAYQYFQSYGLKTVRTRGFNHTGPRRGDVFVTSNFAKQLASIELGLQEPVIRVGNLEAVRDFTDVRDMVRAYWLAVDQGHAGRGLQPRHRQRHHHPGAARPAAVTVDRQGRRGAGPRAHAPVGRGAADRRQQQVPPRHRLGARGAVRQDAR
jgi:GDP-4-dehydro-6-deoxy-D-mannose reductase